MFVKQITRRRMTLLGALLLAACSRDLTSPLDDDPSVPPVSMPASIAVLSGDAQTGAVGATLPLKIRLRVTDRNGAPKAGVHVLFRILIEHGGSTDGVAISGPDGVVESAWTLGPRVESQRLVAEVTDPAGLSVLRIVTATAEAGAVARVTMAWGNAQAAMPEAELPISPGVRVFDEFDNPVAGVPVVFSVDSGGGSVTRAVDTTNHNGTASVGAWRLGSQPGTNILVATVAGDSISGNPVIFRALALPHSPWRARADLPEARGWLAAAESGPLLYAMGGLDIWTWEVVGTVEAYDPSSDSWTTRAPMPTPRAAFSIGVVNGILYAIGGFDAQFNTVATVEAYDPSTNTWSTKAPLPVPRADHASGVVNGVIYVVGGDGQQVVAFDPNTNSWQTKSAVVQCSVECVAAVVNDVLYAFGIYGYSDTGMSIGLTAYDPVSDHATSRSSQIHGVWEMTGAESNGRVHLLIDGGYRHVIYDPTHDAWGTAEATVAEFGCFLTAGTVGGVVHAIGGMAAMVRNHEAYVP